MPSFTKGKWYYVEYVPNGNSINGVEEGLSLGFIPEAARQILERIDGKKGGED